MNTYNSWVGHRPLCCSPDAFVQAILVSVVTAVSVGKEEGIDVAFLQELSKLDPIIKFAFGGRLILWILC